jgi:hypothetical protein
MAARKRGGVAKEGLLRRWKHEITVAIMRRRAAMARAALPRQRPRELWLLHGVADEAVHAGGRLHAVGPDDAADDVDEVPHRDILESDLDD